MPGLLNCGDVSHNDAPGYRAADTCRGAESRDRADMSPVCGSKDAGRSDVSMAGHLRRWVVGLRNRVTGICKVATQIWLRPRIFGAVHLISTFFIKRTRSMSS